MKARFSLSIRLVVALLLFHVHLLCANAAELKVLSSAAFADAFQELAPAFENSTGHRLTITYDSASALMRRIDAGENFDAVILTSSAINDLVKSGRVIAPTRAEVARAEGGAPVRRGASKLEIGSSEALKFTSFTAAIGTRAFHHRQAVAVDAAKSLIRFLAGPSAATVFTRKGMQPTTTPQFAGL